MKRFALAAGPLLAGLLASAPAGAAPTTPFTEELLKARDPFKRPDIVEKVVIKGDLEHYPVEAFTVVGILTGPLKLRAMLLGPDGRTHFGAESMKIGTRGGMIRKITPNAVFVREKVMNVLGQEELLDSKLPLREKETAGEGKSTGGLISRISPVGGGAATQGPSTPFDSSSALHGGPATTGQQPLNGASAAPPGGAPPPSQFQAPQSQAPQGQAPQPQGNAQPANPANLTPPTATWGQTNQPPPGRAAEMFVPSVGGVIIPQGGTR